MPAEQMPQFRSLPSAEAEGYAYAVKPYEDAAAANRLQQAIVYDAAHEIGALGGPKNTEASNR